MALSAAPQKNWYEAEIAAAAAAAGLDPLLVTAVMWQESGGKTAAYRYEPLFWTRYLATNPQWMAANPDRVSASYGLLQIMHVDAQELGYLGEPEGLFVPAVGLMWGCRKLASLVAWAKGDVEQALASFNGGQGGNSVRPFRNGVYATQVLARMKYLAKGSPNAPVS